MVTRFKLIAAALGLVIAAGTIGDASARTIHRTIVKTTVVTRSIGHVGPRFHRVVVLPTHRVFRPYLAYRAPVLVKRHVFIGPRIARAPIMLRRHAMLHRTVFTKTIIR